MFSISSPKVFSTGVNSVITDTTVVFNLDISVLFWLVIEDTLLTVLFVLTILLNVNVLTLSDSAEFNVDIAVIVFTICVNVVVLIPPNLTHLF